MSLTLFILYIFMGLVAVWANLHARKSAYTVRTHRSSEAPSFIKVKGTNTDLNLIFLVLVIVFSWLCAVRSLDTSDARPYYDYYMNLNNHNFFVIDGMYRLGFEYLTKVIRLFFGKEYKVYFGLIAVLNCLIVYLAIKKADIKTGLALAIYLGFCGIYYNYIVLRQGLAISMVILAYAYMDKSKGKSLVCIFIAALFHESALVAVVPWLLSFMKRETKPIVYYVLIVASIVLYCTKIINGIIEPLFTKVLGWFPYEQFHRYSLYFQNVELTNDISVFHLGCYAVTALLVYLRPKNDLLYSKILFTNVLGLLILGLFSSIVAIIRVVDYLTAATYIFLIPMSIKKFSNFRQGFIACSCFLMCSLFYLRYITAVVPFF